jgi:mRNA interferase MazF
MMKISRGEIYWVEFDPVKGSEQGGLRPAVVVQNDVGNRFSPTTVVAVITRTIPPKPYPFVVIIESEESGLPDRSVVNCSQVATIQVSGSGSRMRPPPGETDVCPIGRLGRKSLERVGAALRYNLAI